MDKNSYAIRMASWAKIVAEANNSGMTKTQWCREHDVRLRQFHYWQKRIRDFLLENPDTTIEEITGHGSQLPMQVPGQSFYEISIPTRLSSEPAASLSALMLQVNDLQLYIGEGFSEAALSSVIKVIRNA